MKELKVNLLEMNTSQPASFQSESIISMSDYIDLHNIVLRPFENNMTSKKSINLNDVIGHDQGYDSFTWGQALNGKALKRIKYNLEKLNTNPDYYLSIEDKDAISFIDIEGKLFISTGKHRTIIAKFFYYFNDIPPIFGNVSVMKSQIDYVFMHLKGQINHLKEQYPNLTFELTYTDNESENCLFVKDGVDNMAWYTRAQVGNFIYELKHPSLKQKLAGNPYYKFVSFGHWLQKIPNFKTLTNQFLKK